MIGASRYVGGLVLRASVRCGNRDTGDLFVGELAILPANAQGVVLVRTSNAGALLVVVIGVVALRMEMLGYLQRVHAVIPMRPYPPKIGARDNLMQMRARVRTAAVVDPSVRFFLVRVCDQETRIRDTNTIAVLSPIRIRNLGDQCFLRNSGGRQIYLHVP